MVSVTVRDREKRPGERAHVRGEITFGYGETLYPADVELKTIETISFTTKSWDAVPLANITNPGNVGNSAMIRWVGQVGSPYQNTFGTYLIGSKDAYFDIVGG